MSTRRVVVTGCGAISAVGPDVASFWDSLTNGRSGIAPVHAFESRAFPIKVAAEVKTLPAGMGGVPRPLALAYTAAEEAAQQGQVARLAPTSRCGVIAGGVPDFADLGISDLLRAYLGERSRPKHSGLLRCARFRLESMATLVAALQRGGRSGDPKAWMRKVA